MQWLAALCVKRPVFATVLILSLSVIGAFSFTRLGVDRFPKVDIPTVIVTTVQPGAAPEQIETEITDKIEEAVNTISGIDELRSVSSEGVSQVMISFVLEKDGDVARVEDGQADSDTVANVNGSSTVLLQVRRQSGTNTVEVVDAVLERLKDVKGNLPVGYDVRVVRDMSEFIKASIHNVEEHLVVGSILAALVVLLFLTNLRSTII